MSKQIYKSFSVGEFRDKFKGGAVDSSGRKVAKAALQTAGMKQVKQNRCALFVCGGRAFSCAMVEKNILVIQVSFPCGTAKGLFKIVGEENQSRYFVLR